MDRRGDGLLRHTRAFNRRTDTVLAALTIAVTNRNFDVKKNSKPCVRFNLAVLFQRGLVGVGQIDAANTVLLT